MQNLYITLNVVDAAYHPQDTNTGRKIISCLNTVEVSVVKEIKSLVLNPCVISALLALHKIPMWRDLFMNAEIYAESLNLSTLTFHS
jgi:hypothetical protein